MASTKEPLKLPTDCSREEFERVYDFVKKIKEMDEEPNHRGIFIQYNTALDLYKSGSLNSVDLKNRIKTIFKNCNVLLAGFDQILKDLDTDSRRDAIAVHASNLKRINGFVKALRRDCEELQGEFINAFEIFNKHCDVQILKEEVDMILRDYPFLKEEFRMILVAYGLLLQDE